jgi:hypothetical protein
MPIVDLHESKQMSPDQAAPRFAPAIPLSAAAVPRPKSPASSEPAALSKLTHFPLLHPKPTMPIPLTPPAANPVS